MKTFEPFSPDVLRGINLIEASAGTGKTYSITTLVLRLLIERGLKLHQILAVTFTEAATGELRSRIRSRMRDAQQFLRSQRKGASADFGRLFSGVDKETAMGQLAEALSEVDSMPVYTIHGFCKQMLEDYAFETGQPFGAEMVPDNNEFYRELAEDFYRKKLASYPVEFLLQSKKTSPAALAELAKELSKPLVHLPIKENLTDQAQREAQEFEELGGNPEILPSGLDDFSVQQNKLEELAKRWDHTLLNLEAQLEEVEMAKGVLLQACNDGILKANSYKPEKVEDWFKDFTQIVSLAGKPGGSVFDAGDLPEKLSNGEITAGTKKNQAVPEHSVFNAIQELVDIRTSVGEMTKELEWRMVREFDEWMRKEAPRRKQDRAVQFFDDLLMNLFQALKSQRGRVLADLIRTRFPAALIDEFQDTDSVQWGIFSSIYDPGKMSDDKNTLLLIGDPKQSIFSFRNADIRTYLKAKETAAHVWTMNTNYRSEPHLIAALNHWADCVGADQCFNLPGKIDYVPVEPKDWGNSATMTFPAGDASLMFLPDPAPDGNKGEVEEEVVSLTVKAVLRVLLNNRLGEDPLRPGDLAVLVHKHSQAEKIKAALNKSEIPAVIVSKHSVFDSETAPLVYHFLQAVLNLQDEKLLRGLLLREFFKYSAQQVDDLDEKEWSDWVERIRTWNEIWKNNGIAALFAEADLGAGFRKNFAEQSGMGERSLTDFHHLAELLIGQELEHRMSPPALLRWMEQQFGSEDKAGDEAVVRLESDAGRVQVVTIHCSKGLEYPVVFCPFLWAGKTEKSLYSSVFSDGEIRVYDFFEKHEDQIKELDFNESLRLQYVALTRAKHQLWVCAAKGGKQNKRSPLHHWGVVSGALANLFGCEHICNANVEILGETKILAAPDPVRLNAPAELSRTITQNWLMHSYSSLAGEAEPGQYKDCDAGANEPEPLQVKPEGVFALPKGAVFGVQLHELFEQLDFQADAEVRAAAVKRLCEQAGYDPGLCGDLLQLVNQTLDSPLHPHAFRLSDIPRDKRLVELDFHFPINAFRRKRLADLTGAGVRFPLEECRGFIKGFMDLVFERDGKFWIADYKTNYLGSRAEDYAGKALQQAMDEHGYVLQYHLYTLALHRFLRLKLPGYNYEQHIGGALYLFVRGMDGQNGVFYERVPLETVNQLDDLFAKGGF